MGNLEYSYFLSYDHFAIVLTTFSCFSQWRVLWTLYVGTLYGGRYIYIGPLYIVRDRIYRALINRDYI